MMNVTNGEAEGVWQETVSPCLIRIADCQLVSCCVLYLLIQCGMNMTY
jgi:hypothetical protein